MKEEAPIGALCYLHVEHRTCGDLLQAILWESTHPQTYGQVERTDQASRHLRAGSYFFQEEQRPGHALFRVIVAAWHIVNYHSHSRVVAKSRTGSVKRETVLNVTPSGNNPDLCETTMVRMPPFSRSVSQRAIRTSSAMHTRAGLYSL